jgi:hypothetical protein
MNFFRTGRQIAIRADVLAKVPTSNFFRLYLPVREIRATVADKTIERCARTDFNTEGTEGAEKRSERKPSPAVLLRGLLYSTCQPCSEKMAGMDTADWNPHLLDHWQTMRRFIAVAAIVLFWGIPSDVYAYSVLAHEAIIDAAWDKNVRPLLLERFPNATPDELRRAHAFAYGGAIVQDLGYYPHGSHFYSDLVHYVRGGDFIRALLHDSTDLNEYAFALGALAHYASDLDGHRLAVNRAVPLLYPRLGNKYGSNVTYEDDPATHLKTEFGFDVLEVAKGRFAPDSYHDFIGFEVAKPLLEHAFQDTYSIPLQSVFDDLDHAIGSYRYAVSSTIPKATKIAWALKEGEIERDMPGMTRKKFLYNLSRASYEKEWGKDYRKPGFGEKFLAFLISLMPKVGPLKALAFRVPTPQTENMFMGSFNTALEHYQQVLAEQRAGHLELPNSNFDTGDPTQPGAYFMADQTYAHLLDSLAKDQFKSVSADLRSDILAYYRDSAAPIATKKNAKEWASVTKELEELKSATASRALLSDPGPPTEAGGKDGPPESSYSSADQSAGEVNPQTDVSK